MAPHSSTRLRLAAIRFLNPAPLMWDFDHPPRAAALAERYALHSTTPALCAEELLSGRADLGLIPIASLTPDLAIVPGCAIASLDRVRSIQLIVKLSQPGAPFTRRLSGRDESTSARVPHSRSGVSTSASGNEEPKDTDLAFIDSILRSVRTVAADTASRSSLVYAQLLFQKFVGHEAKFLPAPADPIAMLAQADAALLIGDPALLALEQRSRIEAAAGPCLWLDLAHQWQMRTGLPWVAAVWAVRPQSLKNQSLAAASLSPARLSANALITDLTQSRDHGLTHIETLVAEWSARIALPPDTIRHYLTRNIHYTLDDACIVAIRHLRALAAEADLLPPLPELRLL